MLTPTKATLTDDQLARIDISALSSGNKLKLRNTITIGESGKAACWNGHEFEACTIRVKAYPNAIDLELPELPRIRHPREYAMDVYYPIDPRIIESDVAGAIRAYSNDTNDGWLFAHTDEGTHHDYELQLLAATDGVFQPFFRQLQVDAFSAAESVRTNAQRQMAVLSAFYGQVVVEARNIARGTFLGEREQVAHPREGWLDRDISSAVAAVKAKWTATRSADLTVISAALTYVERSLTMPPVDTRWDRAARVASAGADDDGFEYCYTLRDSSGRIAAAADLPDPNWNFDAFGDGVTRGTQVYLDSEPRPWVVRFKRPIPRGTNAGADVGSVPWVQEPAYRLRK